MPDPKEIKTETEGTPKEQPKVTEEKTALPKTDFFQGDNLENWATEMGLEEEQPKVEAKPEKKEPEEKPCLNCDEQSREPIKTITVDGKPKHYYTQEQIDAGLSQGASFTQKSQALASEKRETDEQYKKVAGPLQKIVNALDSGEISLPKKEAEQIKDDILNNEEVDPEIRKAIQERDVRFEAQQKELNALKVESAQTKEVKQKEDFTKGIKALEDTYTELRKETAFDDIKDEESGMNISELAYAGFVSTLANQDRIAKAQDPNYKQRPVDVLMKTAAQHMSKIENHYKTKYGNSGNTEQVLTSDTVMNSHPEIAQEIGQQAITEYLEGKRKTAPIAKGTKDEAKDAGGGKKEIKGLDDALSQAGADPEILEGLAKFGKKYSRQTGGIT